MQFHLYKGKCKSFYIKISSPYTYYLVLSCLIGTKIKISSHGWVLKMADVASFAKVYVHFKFGYLENKKCKLSQILNILPFISFQLKGA